ncbi:hypothetical protein DHEL01_v206463 [Diaporthe helianthi]|uniref:Uncharacterized protein n=1 Tax=Diaporthe helianthi TaxID=158607 RepID=A0A2P5HY20_DIAHE|nr:hypothetical protein DHEL01_v206463 [Diaporthe helianthi]
MRTAQAFVALFAATAYGRVARRAAFADGDACIAAQALADGIQSNIDLQMGEQASVERVKAAVSQDPIDQAAFTAAKTQLLDFVNAGISARENNQAIAPEGNPAIDGLGIVQKAQAEELQLAQSLKGDASDLDIVSQLETDFAGGIKQNQQNAADVVSPQTGWIFGAVMVSQALVVAGILSLRKRRHEKLAKADEGYEMRLSHEDSLT